MSLFDFDLLAARADDVSTGQVNSDVLESAGDGRTSRIDSATPSDRRETAEALVIYMREVGRFALLTPEEEVAVARRIQRGDEAARERMICANLRLVIKIAQYYDGLGLPLLDLISEGNIGLMRAVDLFDPDKGTKFSIYGSLWIKQSMRRALSGQSRTIRLPVNATDRVHHLRKAARKLEEEFLREPADDELAVEVGLSVARVAQLRTATIRPLSLDAPLREGDHTSLGAVLPDEEALHPGAALERDERFEAVSRLLPRLSQREQLILRHHFGLDDAPEMTLERLGEKLGLTRERIRQLQVGALARLRAMLTRLEAPGRETILAAAPPQPLKARPAPRKRGGRAPRTVPLASNGPSGLRRKGAVRLDRILVADAPQLLDAIRFALRSQDNAAFASLVPDSGEERMGRVRYVA